jgi:hypothetical protein
MFWPNDSWYKVKKIPFLLILIPFLLIRFHFFFFLACFSHFPSQQPICLMSWRWTYTLPYTQICFSKDLFLLSTANFLLNLETNSAIVIWLGWTWRIFVREKKNKHSPLYGYPSEVEFPHQTKRFLNVLSWLPSRRGCLWSPRQQLFIQWC